MSGVNFAAADTGNGMVGPILHEIFSRTGFLREPDRFRPDKLLAWKTERGSAVQHAGLLRFMDSHDGGAILHLHVSYNPPAGVLGHAAAKVFGSDLESMLEEEFVRIKTFLETEKVPRDAPRAQESHRS